MPEYIPEGSRVQTKNGGLYVTAANNEHPMLHVEKGMVGIAEGPDPEDPGYQIFAFKFEGEENPISVTIMPDLLKVVS